MRWWSWMWFNCKVFNVDNENNVDKANNENNETEIIEAEEVDTGKIDWDW
jgi:hypothetical protein